MANGPNTRASTTIATLATTNVTAIAATRDIVDSLAAIVTIVYATSTFNKITTSISYEVTAYLIQ